MDIYSIIAAGSFAIAVVMLTIVVATCFEKDIKKCIKILKTARSWYSEADKDKFVEMHKSGSMYDTPNTEKRTGNENLVLQNDTNVPSRGVFPATDQLTKHQVGTTAESEGTISEGTIADNDRILQGEVSGTLFEDEEVKIEASVSVGTVSEDESAPGSFKTIIEIALLATDNTMEVDFL